MIETPSPKLHGRILFTELSTKFTSSEEEEAQFSPGQVLPAVQVFSVGETKTSKGTPAVDLSLAKAKKENKLSEAGIKQGSIVAALIKKKDPEGFVLSIENSELEAFCFYKNISDHLDKDGALNSPAVGDRVPARVTELRQGQMGVTLKESSLADLIGDVTTLQDLLFSDENSTLVQEVKREELLTALTTPEMENKKIKSDPGVQKRNKKIKLEP